MEIILLFNVLGIVSGLVLILIQLSRKHQESGIVFIVLGIFLVAINSYFFSENLKNPCYDLTEQQKLNQCTTRGNIGLDDSECYENGDLWLKCRAPDGQIKEYKAVINYG